MVGCGGARVREAPAWLVDEALKFVPCGISTGRGGGGIVYGERGLVFGEEEMEGTAPGCGGAGLSITLVAVAGRAVVGVGSNL